MCLWRGCTRDCQQGLPCRHHTFIPALSFGPAPPTSATPAATAAAKAAAHAIVLEVVQDRLAVSAPIDDATVEQLIDLLPPTLQHLEMPKARMTVVPESVGKFTALRTLHLKDCAKLSALPESVGNLGALHTLDLTDCWNLKTLLKALLASISRLTQLDERSRAAVDEMLRGALTAPPVVLASIC